MSDGTVDKVASINNADLEGGADLKKHYALEDNDVEDFYSTGQEYRAYANDTDKPVWTEEEKKLLGIDKDSLAKKDEEEEKSEEAPVQAPAASTTQSAPKAPAAPAAPSK